MWNMVLSGHFLFYDKTGKYTPMVHLHAIFTFRDSSSFFSLDGKRPLNNVQCQQKTYHSPSYLLILSFKAIDINFNCRINIQNPTDYSTINVWNMIAFACRQLYMFSYYSNMKIVMEYSKMTTISIVVQNYSIFLEEILLT